MKLVLIFIILIIIGVFNYNVLYAQEARPDDFLPLPPPSSGATENRPDDFITPQENRSKTFPPVPNATSRDVGAPFTPPDFNSQDNNFLSNAMIIAKDITLYDQTEIKNYPLSDLPSEDIKAVFNILDSGNVTKVLVNISIDDIKEIQNKLSENDFNNILNRIPLENQNELKERINKN